jgi:hypothetical protein
MSGSSRVDFRSEYYHLTADSPIMNFSSRNPPGYETRWHREWQEKAALWLERVKPILEQRFVMLAAEPDPEWSLQKYDERFPLWNSYGDPKEPLPWRVGFSGMRGPHGTAEVLIAFSRMPSEEARKRLKQELIKDLAMLDEDKGRTLT